MLRTGKNIVAIGLAMLLVSMAFAFSASADHETTSYAEGQFLAGQAPLGEVVDQLGDGLENSGAQACEPEQEDCPEEDFTESPLRDLDPLTGPLGDGLGSNAGAAGSFAQANDGDSRAASGAITNDGIIKLGSAPQSPPANATINLSDSALGELSEIGDVRLETGAISATAELDDNLTRDYNIADAFLVLDVPALDAFDDEADDEADINDPLTLNATLVCELLTGLSPDSLPPTVDCDDAATLDGVISGEITGLSGVFDGLENFTEDGITFDFANGEVRIDLSAALEAITGDDINNQPPNTEILGVILPSLANNLDDLVADANAELLQEILGADGLQLNASIGGTPLPTPLNIDDTEPLVEALQPLFTGLEEGLATAGEGLAGGLSQLVDGLGPLLRLIVNVPDAYTDLIASQGGEPRPDDVGEGFSETALRIQIGAEESGGDAQAADILLANAHVGPNGTLNHADADADAQADADADAQADGEAAAAGDGDGDGNNIADANADAMDADAIADAAADADVTDALPAAGAPNMLPLIILALALIALGGGILLNEKRRLSIAE